jgi:tetratricopeptide (TPR) repeat protein
MSSHARASAVGLLLMSFLGASVFALRVVNDARQQTVLKEALYIPSPRTVKAMSLGYTGLTADLYWTRVVQYFGGKHHAGAQQYKLLAPLLDITTTLDPHLLVAYEFGSIFLAQNPPEGGGDPQAAVELVKKGIRENPEAWRLWYHLGFIYFQELHDNNQALQAFLKGSQVPGALPWMKSMAAAMAQQTDQADLARYLWTEIYENTQEPNIRNNAKRRLLALRVDSEVRQLQEVADRYRTATGHAPASFLQLAQAGFLRGSPVDPTGRPYLLVDGRVQVSNPASLPFITKGLPPAQHQSPQPPNSR